MEDAVMAAIRRSVLDIFPDLDPALVTEDRSLQELGCNSVDRVDVVAMTMEDLGVSVAASDFRGVRNIGALATLLRRHA
jgi:polyketide biosynthesis acyl carrier protein